MPGGGDQATGQLNGGEFLLQLLKNPPQHHPSPPPPPQILSHDPAVAALGPSLPVPLPPLLQSNGVRPPWPHRHPHHSPPPFAPHNFFVQNPNASSIPSASPNPNFNSASPPAGFDQGIRQQQNVEFGYNADHVGKSGFLGPKPPSAQQQQQRDLIFGSLMGNECVVNGNDSERLLISQHGKGKMRMPLPEEGRGVSLGSNRRLNGLEVENQQNLVDFDRGWHDNLRLPRLHERSGSKSSGAVNYGRQMHNGHNYRAAVPPPALSGKQMSGGKREYANRRNFGQTGDRGRNNYVVARHQGDNNESERERERERGFALKNERYSGYMSMSDNRTAAGQLDYSGSHPGSNLHSVSASDIEESMMELHREDGERQQSIGIETRDRVKDDFKDHSDLDDLEEHLVDALGLEDELGEGSNIKKNHGTRDKVISLHTSFLLFPSPCTALLKLSIPFPKSTLPNLLSIIFTKFCFFSFSLVLSA